MLENLNVLAIVIIAIWLAAIGYYFYTARQQDEIRNELEALRAMLDEGEKERE